MAGESPPHCCEYAYDPAEVRIIFKTYKKQQAMLKCEGDFGRVKKHPSFRAIEYSGVGKDKTCSEFEFSGYIYTRKIVDRLPVSGEVLRVRASFAPNEEATAAYESV